jgi:hypothetical protein
VQSLSHSHQITLLLFGQTHHIAISQLHLNSSIFLQKCDSGLFGSV